MTYEEFCTEMGKHEAAGKMVLGPEMKEVFRTAAREQFDHLWTYLTVVESVPVVAPSVREARANDSLYYFLNPTGDGDWWCE